MAGQTVILVGLSQRLFAKRLIDAAPANAVLNIREATRSSEQNAKFHAICSDIARSPMKWAGKRRNADEWKVLLVSGHTAATKGNVEIVPGLEGEFVNIRESTARMGVARASSLIEYTLAWCALNGIELQDDYTAPSSSQTSGAVTGASPTPVNKSGPGTPPPAGAASNRYAEMKG